MQTWQKLLDRALRGLDAVAAAGTPVPRCSLGGSTALMLQHGHRVSRRIAIIVPDPPSIPILSPRPGGAGVWDADAWDETAHSLTLCYAEGDIRFIAAGPVSEVPDLAGSFEGRAVPMEHAVEIAVKKLHHRAAGLTPRDIFDVAVVMTMHPDILGAALPLLVPVKPHLRQRLAILPQAYYEQALDELDVLPRWEFLKPHARSMVADLIEAMS